MLNQALAAAADSRLHRWTRWHAARLASHIWQDVDHSERLLAAGMTSIAGAMVEPSVAAMIARMVVRRRSRDHRLRASLLRVVGRGHREGRHDSVAAVLAAMVDLEGLPREVPTRWFEAVARGDAAECHALSLLEKWTPRFGAEAVRAVVRERPHLLQDVPIEIVGELHAAEPTVEGWETLARPRGWLDRHPLGLSFGDRLGAATETLWTALANARGGASRSVLRRWLAELEG